MNKAGRSAQNRGVREDCGGKDFCALTFLVLFASKPVPSSAANREQKVRKELAFTTTINLRPANSSRPGWNQNRHLGGLLVSGFVVEMLNCLLLHHSSPQIRTDFFDPIQSFNNMYEMERMTSHPDHFEM